MGQWASELADKTDGHLKVLLHHGPKRSKNPQDLLDYDVVLVTYQIIAQEWRHLWTDTHAKASSDESCSCTCACVKWHRLVLDEAHTAKNPKAGWTRTCAQLASDNRYWSPLSKQGCCFLNKFCASKTQ